MSQKESGVAPMSSLKSLIPGTAMAATPPWFVSTVSRREIGRGRLTTMTAAPLPAGKYDADYGRD